jgi:hypothetical protein
MRAKVAAFYRVGIIGFTLALSFFATPHVAAQKPKEMTPELQKVREALDKYQDPIVAVHDGYFSTLGCVEYPKPGGPGRMPYPRGGMGVHFFNVALMGKLDPLKPQVLVYQPVGGKLRLVAAEYFVPLSPEVKEPPQLFGRPFDGPMEGHHPLMPHELKHYDLHVWLWKKNPAGLFAATNPDIRCPKAAYTFRETAPRLVSPN